MTDHERRNIEQTTTLQQYLAVEKLCVAVDNMTPERREIAVQKLDRLMSNARAIRQAQINHSVNASDYITCFMCTPIWAFIIWALVRYA